MRVDYQALAAGRRRGLPDRDPQRQRRPCCSAPTPRSWGCTCTPRRAGCHRLPLRVAPPLRRHLRHRRRRSPGPAASSSTGGSRPCQFEMMNPGGHGLVGALGPPGPGARRVSARSVRRGRGPGMSDVDRNGVDGVTRGADRAYLAQVMAEIDEEVRRRRASGDLPARLERELDELFLEHSPVAGRGGGLGEALRMVDAAAFIDPVVPIASSKSGGARRQEGLAHAEPLVHAATITHQVSQFAAAVSRSLHLLDDRLAELAPAARGPAGAAGPGGRGALGARPRRLVGPRGARGPGRGPGRVLHAAARRRVAGTRAWPARGRRLRRRPAARDRSSGASSGGTDLREEGLLEHLRAVEPAALGGRRVTGVVDGDDPRRASPAARGGPRPPGPRRDLGRPLHLPGRLGCRRGAARGGPRRDGRCVRPPGAPACPDGLQATVTEGPSAADYLVAAVLAGHHPPGDPVSTPGGPPGAPGRAPVRAGPDRPRRHRQPHPAAAPGAAGGRVAIGDLRRGHPRRAAGRDAPGRALPRVGRPRRRPRLPVLDLLGGGRVPGRPARDRWSSTTTTSPAPTSTAAGSPATAARSADGPGAAGPPGPPGRPGHGRQRLQRGGPAARPAVGGRRWCPSSSTWIAWPVQPDPRVAGRLAAPARRPGGPTGCSSDAWCRRRPSTTW